MSGPLVALAVVRDDPPAVYIAEDIDVLQRTLALHVVARTDRAQVDGSEVMRWREALMDERWSEAVFAWIRHTGIAVDVYTERVLTAADLPDDTLGMQLQFSPLFREA